MIEKHVVDFLDMKGESAGLGFYSEQAMEAVHHDFKIIGLFCLMYISNSRSFLKDVLGEGDS